MFDFGCGCGRNARQLLQQKQRPESYVGVDISRKMIAWCQDNLARSGVEFHHHDVQSPNSAYAPDNSSNQSLPLRQHGRDFTLINAHSVFTHLRLEQTRFYLPELTAMLASDGLIRTTWFLFNRDWFPVLGSDQHCLFVNDTDPTQAINYDWGFLKALIRQTGLKIVDVSWTRTFGFQSGILLAAGDAFEDRADTLTPPGTLLGFGPAAVPAAPPPGDYGNDELMERGI